MNLKFTNAQTEFTTVNLLYSISPYVRRVKFQDRYGGDGATAMGDQFIEARDLNLKFDTAKENDTDYIGLLNNLVGFFRTDLEPFYLVDTDNNRRANIVLLSISDESANEGTVWRIGRNGVSCKMVDPHWEDMDETTVSTTTDGIANGETMAVDNDGQISVYPEIRIQPSDTNTDFTLTNSTTGASFTLGSSIFVIGTTFVMNAQTGECYIDDGSNQVDAKSSLADGSGFISLLPGTNTLEYSSAFGQVYIDVVFRKRYAF